MSALFQANILEKRGVSSWEEQIVLFNTSKVGVYYERSSDNKAVFEYDRKGSRREKPDHYVFDGRLNEFKTLLAEAAERTYLSFSGNDDIQWRFPNKRSYQDGPVSGTKAFVIPLSQFILALSVPDSTSSEVQTANSAFEEIWYKVPYTLDEIDGSASNSGSLAYTEGGA